MPSLSYSFSQLEAFTAVAEHGSLMKAAMKLEKDRTTLRDLIDLLEDSFGYPLFARQGRSLQLTAEGEKLHRQAHLLLRQARAFDQFARQVPSTEVQELGVAYDPFTPRRFLKALITRMATRGIRLSLRCTSRAEGEKALASGEVDLGFFQANNHSVGSDMEWRALGAIDMDFYAAEPLFEEAKRPCSLLDLSLTPQVVMHSTSDVPMARRLQISGNIIVANELEMLRSLMEAGCGWGFLPTHFEAVRWKNVMAIPTVVGNEGISQTMVTIWRPGSEKRMLIDDSLTWLSALWREVSTHKECDV
ncbi:MULTISPECIES: LysR family transcriptional regulator [unclassified Cedecea]|uniref:LysR family transcriptional regulator n=1 Tax=unclassified Cedecea TaxID=2649846 RepID=UPI00301AF301